MEWAENGLVVQEKRLIAAYGKTNVVGIWNFHRNKLPTSTNNGNMGTFQGHRF
jgi:hypothetical protein